MQWNAETTHSYVVRIHWNERNIKKNYDWSCTIGFDNTRPVMKGAIPRWIIGCIHLFYRLKVSLMNNVKHHLGELALNL